MTAAEAARLRVTPKSSVAPAASCTLASATETPTGPCTVLAGSAFESAVPSSVHIAPVSEHEPVGPSAMLMAAFPAGVTVASQLRLLPFTMRLTCGVSFVPPCITVSERSRIVL